MTDPTPARSPLRVLIATPLGRGGKGGIDRLMDAVRDRLQGGQAGRWSVSFGVTRGKSSILLSPIFLAAFLVRLAALKARGRVDLLHINLSSDGSTRRKAVVGRFARMLGVPYVVHLHGSRFRTFFDEGSPAVQARARSLFSGASRVLVLGGVWRDFITARVPGVAERIVVLPNAAEAITPSAEERDGTVRILFLGRVGQRKGVYELVSALSRISDLAGWRAVIAGDGEVSETRSRIAELGLTARVDVPGWLGPDAARELLASSDILVLPSFDENLPMSVIEGMSAGLAVVATPVGAVEDIVRDGDTGLLVPPGDAESLAVALRRLILDPDLRKRLGMSARAHHRRHLDVVPYVARLADIWSEALN